MVTKTKVYIYNETRYTSWEALSEAVAAYSTTFIPRDFSDEQLAEIGINVEYVDPPIESYRVNFRSILDTYTRSHITGGFYSEASGEKVKYESDTETQITMQGITLNVDTELFAEKYPAGCPVRGYKEGETVKSIQYLSPTQVKLWMADLSLHIGLCKQWGWEKQAAIEVAETYEELKAINFNDFNTWVNSFTNNEVSEDEELPEETDNSSKDTTEDNTSSDGDESTNSGGTTDEVVSGGVVVEDVGQD